MAVRVALVHMRHAYSGGTERYLNLVAKHLAERGDEVTIVCRSHEAHRTPPCSSWSYVRSRSERRRA